MDFILKVLEPGWVGSIIGLVSLAAALLLYRRSRVNARPVYQQRGLRLIGSDEAILPADVEIRFRGQPVERLTKTYIVFWNAGTATIRGSDVVADDPLRCEFSQQARVLEVSLVKNTRSANKFVAMIDANRPNCVLLSLDYLDPQDGATIEILHTDSNRYPTVKGTIRGVPKGLIDRGRIVPTRINLPPPTRFNQLPPLRRVRIFALTSLALGLILVLGGVLLHDKMPLPANALKIVRWMLIGAGAIYIAFPVGLLWSVRRRFPAALHTPELDE